MLSKTSEVVVRRGGRTRREFLVQSGVVVASVGIGGSLLELLEACAGGGNQGGPSPVKGGHIIEGRVGDPDTINPLLGGEGGFTGYLLFGALLGFNADGSPTPIFAKSLPTVSSDGLTYTFELRPDLKWTDGQPITSDDVLFTVNLQLQKQNLIPSVYFPLLSQYLDSVTAPSPTRVVFKLKQVHVPFLVQPPVTSPLIPNHVLANMNAKQVADWFTSPTVVSGPFKMQKWDKGSQIVLVRNDAYGGPVKPNIATYVRKTMGNSAAITTQLQTSEIDVGDLALGDVVAVNSSDVKVATFPKAVFLALNFNLRPDHAGGKIFGNKSVRQAMLYGTDRQTIIKTAFFGYADVAKSYVPPTSPIYNPNTKPAYNFDPSQAASLLDAAGWKMGSNGTRTKDGQPLQFTILTYSGTAFYQATSELLQAQWKRIGADVSIKAVSPATALPIYLQTHEYDVFLDVWGTDLQTPDLSFLVASKFVNLSNTANPGYSNPQLDPLLDQAQNTPDLTKRKQIWAQIQDIMAEDAPSYALLWTKGVKGISARVKGAQFGRSEHLWEAEAWVTDGK